MKLPLGLPKRKDLRGDLADGLTDGLVQIPDAMASAILALVKPVNGLSTLIIGARMDDQLARTGLAELISPENTFAAHSLVYRSTEEALAAGPQRLGHASGTQTPREGT